MGSPFLQRDIKNLRMDDLLSVQFEIEEKLISAIKRRKELENKIFNLETLLSKEDEESTDSIEKKNSDESPPKMSEDSPNKAHSSSNHHKSKYIPTIEDLIVPQESDKDYPEIPELGKHSETFPVEDLKEEMIEGSKSVENKKGLLSDSAQDHTEKERILKLGEDESSSMEDKDEASLCDKLVCSLISESLMTHSDNIMTDDCDDDVVRRTNPDTVQEPTVADNSLEERMPAAFVTAGNLSYSSSC